MTSPNSTLVSILIVIQLILLISALFNLRKTHATNGPKWLWALVIIFVNTLGPIVYFLFGRKKTV